MDESYERLKEELERTAVISKEFKDHILTIVIQVVREAYQRGRRDAMSHRPKKAGR